MGSSRVFVNVANRTLNGSDCVAVQNWLGLVERLKMIVMKPRILK